MKTVTAFGYAKVNLFLDIVGEKNGFHQLDTVVTTIDLKDKITVSSRKDKVISVREREGLYSVNLNAQDNNAYRAAQKFMDEFNTCGVNVTINKHIPIGSGLGGSSADISAVLNAMKKMYDIDADVKPLADSLGSDSGYLLTGGYARLNGKGDIVTPLPLENKLYFVIIPASGGVNTKECFALYDKLEKQEVSQTANTLITALENGFYDKTYFYNALYKPATELNKNVETAYVDLKNLSPRAVCMSGSGSSVFAIFDTPELCLWAQSKLKRKYPDVIVTESLTRKEINKEIRSIYSI